MKEGIQTELPDHEVNEYGCYLLCILEMSRRRNTIADSAFDPMRVINLARECGFVREECYVLDPVGVYNLVGKDKVRAAQAVDSVPVGESYYITVLKKPMYTHFVLSFSDGTSWDPRDPKRPSAKAYKAVSYRVLL